MLKILHPFGRWILRQVDAFMCISDYEASLVQREDVADDRERGHSATANLVSIRAIISKGKVLRLFLRIFCTMAS